MGLTKRYDPKEVEPRLAEFWQQAGIYEFDRNAPGKVYSIDTPPPTVSGNLHLGHVYSYSHPDFMARFYRMNGYNVYYPMGYDDNGLPTERLVEKHLGITAQQVGRSVFIEQCLQVSEQAERDYERLWKRLGLSIDWRYTYRTIDDLSRRTSQLSFIDLARQGLAYRREAPAIWCPECRTAIAQAELNDLDRQSEFVTLAFHLEEVGKADAGQILPIATTRPELLPACVAVFVHTDDIRFNHLVGKHARVPYFAHSVPILSDPVADPEKGSGAVMCCTFGDTTDVSWWNTHHLPLVEAIGKDGRMTEAARDFAGIPASEARRAIVLALHEQGLVLQWQTVSQSIRVHERCDTPVEYIIARQWFVRLLDFKEKLLEAGEHLNWRPGHMKARYRAWVENLSWDWCLSRQRYFGVPIPVWYCKNCGGTILAEPDQLPVDPTEQPPGKACRCGSRDFIPEEDIFDTWATSSMTPQIVGKKLEDESLYQKVFPFSLRPQAHEIIRTWAFYTLTKSVYHFDTLPWKDVLISGWGMAGEGMPKLSKSRGGGPMPPLEMIESYSADAVRYWTSSTGPGKDTLISVEKIETGARVVTKLWNVARFSERFLEGYQLPSQAPFLTPADRWILARLQTLIRRVTGLFENYDYASAKAEVEVFFWRDLADNYLEMAKQRLYDSSHPLHAGAIYTLYHVLLNVLKLFAPFLPFITEEIYQGIYTERDLDGGESIHVSSWPAPDKTYEDGSAESLGDQLVKIATAVRRFKSEHNLPLGSELHCVQLAVNERASQIALLEAEPDLIGITRARRLEVVESLDPGLELLTTDGAVQIAVQRAP